MPKKATKITKYYLRVRDHKDWSYWHNGPEFDSLEELFKTYVEWFKQHPRDVFQFAQRDLWI